MPYRPSAVGIGSSPAQQVADAVQVEAVQAQRPAQEGQPGREGLVFHPATGSGGVVSPSPRAFSISTMSSHWPNFQPQDLSMPTWREAQRAVHADRAGVGRVADHRDQLADAARLGLARPVRRAAALPRPLPARIGVQVDRVLGREAVGRPRLEPLAIGEAQHLAVVLGHQVGQALGQHVGAARAMSASVGGVVSKVPVPCSTWWA